MKCTYAKNDGIINCVEKIKNVELRKYDRDVAFFIEYKFNN